MNYKLGETLIVSTKTLKNSVPENAIVSYTGSIKAGFITAVFTTGIYKGTQYTFKLFEVERA